MLPKPFTREQLERALHARLDVIDPARLDLGEFHAEALDVLVVDASVLARNAISRTLRGMGIENIQEANDGAQAIALIERACYEFVITDYNIPAVDGAQRVEHVRSKSSQRSVPILMVTTEGDLGKLAAVEQAGVSAICDKPFEPATVKAIIERIVNTL